MEYKKWKTVNDRGKLREDIHDVIFRCEKQDGMEFSLFFSELLSLGYGLLSETTF